MVLDRHGAAHGASPHIPHAFAVSPTIIHAQGLASIIVLGLIMGIIRALDAMRVEIGTALSTGIDMCLLWLFRWLVCHSSSISGA